MKKIVLLLSIAFACVVFIACKKNSSSTTTTTNGVLPAMYSKFNSSIQVYTEGNYVVIKANSVPDHKSPYFQPTDPRYEAYNGSNPNFVLNPNRIIDQSLTFKIPIIPTEASSKSATPLGPIGVSINGVAMFNQYAGLSYADIRTKPKDYLAKLLGVDAVITNITRMDKPMSEGAAIAVGVLFGVTGSTNNVTTTINIHEAKRGDLIWKYDYVAQGSIGSSPENLVNALMRNASRKFPYNEKK